ncbi:MAG: ASCH domain-containing protein [Mollicutes bacterium]|nr:ASCH domain-containing protein [Mollicutes bacterium]
MDIILLPIRPKYVEEIFNGNKKYEYRKTIPKRKIKKIIIYSTSPVMKVVGEADVVKVLKAKPNDLWNMTKNYSGIEKEKYDKYFSNSEIAFAYEITNVIKYNNPYLLKEIGIDFYPQSFIYLSENKINFD